MNQKKILISLSLLCISLWAVNQFYNAPENVKELAQLPFNDEPPQKTKHSQQPEENRSVQETIKSTINAKSNEVTICHQSNPIEIPVTFKKDTSTKNPRTITIVNKITKDDITYKKHWSGHHTPSSFHIKINNEEFMNHPNKKNQRHYRARSTAKVPTTTPTEITIVDNEVDVEIFYEFKVMGVSHRRETKQFSTTIPKGTQKLVAQFNWESDSKVLLTPVSEQSL